MDFSDTEGAIGYISDGEPVIPVGVSINAMPMSIKKKEYMETGMLFMVG